MHRVNFITTQQEDDLIVSFTVAGDSPGDILSLTLLRTPKYELILDSDERGISVSWEEDDDEVYAPEGQYLGEIMSRNRLITNKNKKSWRRGSFTPHTQHAGYAKYADYAGYAMYAGYEDFTKLER